MQNQPKRSRTWIWFFLTVCVLAVIAVSALIRYNLGQQLQPADLEKARALWQEKGPKSYRLVYSVKRGEAAADNVIVHVRNGTPDFVTLAGRKIEERQYAYYGMEALLDDIERFLDLDRQEGKPRTYLRAIFDPNDGHVRWFVRRVMGSRERVEITVQALEPLNGSSK